MFRVGPLGIYIKKSKEKPRVRVCECVCVRGYVLVCERVGEWNAMPVFARANRGFSPADEKEESHKTAICTLGSLSDCVRQIESDSVQRRSYRKQAR